MTMDGMHQAAARGGAFHQVTLNVAGGRPVSSAPCKLSELVAMGLWQWSSTTGLASSPPRERQQIHSTCW
jgi:hypothetical protein